MIDKLVETLQKKFAKDKKVSAIYSTSKSEIRFDLESNNKPDREKYASQVATLLKGSVNKTRTTDVDVVNPKAKILIKPKTGAAKSTGRVYYGLLSKFDLKEFDCSAFSKVCMQFTGKKLVSTIKEVSDVIGVSDINKNIELAAKGNMNGITIKLGTFTFKNVIGCIPVTVGEPKADFVFVIKNGKKLTPDAYLSYKLGNDAKGFQNYSGLTNKASPYIFKHEETEMFFAKLLMLNETKTKMEIAQPIKDKKIAAQAVWGMDFKKGAAFGVNNCHAIVQGQSRISGNSLSFKHVMLSGQLPRAGDPYDPIYGARAATGRNTISPTGKRVEGFRVSIFPRAYRSKWLTIK